MPIKNFVRRNVFAFYDTHKLNHGISDSNNIAFVSRDPFIFVLFEGFVSA